ncbi:XRE family transcriptional regulator [Acinetobacter bereziniae]|uniref:XRE family transcriptional regulator n=1 Tax=Acinetobacter bereziniae TaxID=106648 RepID=UPI001D0E0F7D|nr:S24 family peptidase [Acinetobacter bereziniae]
METLGTRLRALRKEKKLTQQAVADAIGVSKTSVIYWEKDENTPKHESLNLLAKTLGVLPDYLLYGIKNIETWDSSTPLEDDEVEIKFFKDFRVACGTGTIGEALETEWRRLRISKSTLKNLGIEVNNCFAMTAYGDSMKGTINDGDTVYVDRGRRIVKDGKIYAICHGGLFKFKRLYNLPLGGIRVVSDNHEEFPEERLSAQDIIDQEFEILAWAWSWQTVESW